MRSMCNMFFSLLPIQFPKSLHISEKNKLSSFIYHLEHQESCPEATIDAPSHF